MAINIFRLDWIIIDSIIILLLISVLISVKLFKERARWRSVLSNESLEIINYLKSEIKFKSNNFLIKSLSFIRNKKKEYRNPLIIFFKTNKNRKILYILAEGLASYGFNVAFVNFEKRSENTKYCEIKDIVSSILEFFNQKGMIANSNYFIINSIKTYFPDLSIVSDLNNCGLFLINPKLTNENLEKLSESSNMIDFKSRTHFIFSKKSNKKLLELNNKKSVKCFEVFTLEKAHESLKYYETIILGMIINRINRNSPK